MTRKILTIIFTTVLFISFGCKKTEESKPVQADKPPQTKAETQKQAQDDVTKENMDQQLDKIEKEIKADVNAQ
ncbi:MAG: hypothetical protein WC496_05285 [Phycisphaerae bacterium]